MHALVIGIIALWPGYLYFTWSIHPDKWIQAFDGINRPLMSINCARIVVLDIRQPRA